MAYDEIRLSVYDHPKATVSPIFVTIDNKIIENSVFLHFWCIKRKNEETTERVFQDRKNGLDYLNDREVIERYPHLRRYLRSCWLGERWHQKAYHQEQSYRCCYQSRYQYHLIIKTHILQFSNIYTTLLTSLLDYFVMKMVLVDIYRVCVYRRSSHGHGSSDEFSGVVWTLLPQQISVFVFTRRVIATSLIQIL